jgi:hypothetical protein
LSLDGSSESSENCLPDLDAVLRLSDFSLLFVVVLEVRWGTEAFGKGFLSCFNEGVGILDVDASHQKLEDVSVVDVLMILLSLLVGPAGHVLCHKSSVSFNKSSGQVGGDVFPSPDSDSRSSVLLGLFCVDQGEYFLAVFFVILDGMVLVILHLFKEVLNSNILDISIEISDILNVFEPKLALCV